MADTLGTTGVLNAHLTELEQVLDFARGFVVARDLMNDYANMGGAPRQSNLSRALEKQLERVRFYLEDNDEPIPES